MNLIVGLNAPQVTLPVLISPSLHSFYSSLHSIWNNRTHSHLNYRNRVIMSQRTPEKSQTNGAKQNIVFPSSKPITLSDNIANTVLISVGSGFGDSQVHSNLVNLESVAFGHRTLSVLSSSIQDVWLSADHQSCMWCNQLVNVLSIALYEGEYGRNMDLKLKRKSQDEPSDHTDINPASTHDLASSTKVTWAQAEEEAVERMRVFRKYLGASSLLRGLSIPTSPYTSSSTSTSPSAAIARPRAVETPWKNEFSKFRQMNSPAFSVAGASAVQHIKLKWNLNQHNFDEVTHLQVLTTLPLDLIHIVTCDAESQAKKTPSETQGTSSKTSETSSGSSESHESQSSCVDLKPLSMAIPYLIRVDDPERRTFRTVKAHVWEVEVNEENPFIFISSSPSSSLHHTLPSFDPQFNDTLFFSAKLLEHYQPGSFKDVSVGSFVIGGSDSDASSGSSVYTSPSKPIISKFRLPTQWYSWMALSARMSPIVPTMAPHASSSDVTASHHVNHPILMQATPSMLQEVRFGHGGHLVLKTVEWHGMEEKGDVDGLEKRDSEEEETNKMRVNGQTLFISPSFLLTFSDPAIPHRLVIHYNLWDSCDLFLRRFGPLVLGMTAAILFASLSVALSSLPLAIQEGEGHPRLTSKAIASLPPFFQSRWLFVSPLASFVTSRWFIILWLSLSLGSLLSPGRPSMIASSSQSSTSSSSSQGNYAHSQSAGPLAFLTTSFSIFHALALTPLPWPDFLESAVIMVLSVFVATLWASLASLLFFLASLLLSPCIKPSGSSSWKISPSLANPKSHFHPSRVLTLPEIKIEWNIESERIGASVMKREKAYQKAVALMEEGNGDENVVIEKPISMLNQEDTANQSSTETTSKSSKSTQPKSQSPHQPSSSASNASISSSLSSSTHPSSTPAIDVIQINAEDSTFTSWRDFWEMLPVSQWSVFWMIVLIAFFIHPLPSLVLSLLWLILPGPNNIIPRESSLSVGTGPRKEEKKRIFYPAAFIRALSHMRLAHFIIYGLILMLVVPDFMVWMQKERRGEILLEEWKDVSSLPSRLRELSAVVSDSRWSKVEITWESVVQFGEGTVEWVFEKGNHFISSVHLPIAVSIALHVMMLRNVPPTVLLRRTYFELPRLSAMVAGIFVLFFLVPIYPLSECLLWLSVSFLVNIALQLIFGEPSRNDDKDNEDSPRQPQREANQPPSSKNKHKKKD